MKILVSGGTGFLGSHAVSELLRRGHAAISLSRTSLPAHAGPGRADAIEHLAADLGGELPVARMRADAYLLCAAYVGPDEATAEAVNLRGAERLLAAAEAHGAAVVSLSTLSVYGSGPHRGQAEGELDPHPESAASRTRADAERLVLDAGGTVLRSALTTGAGDRWVVPSLARVAARLGVPDELRSVRSSVIGAPALARAAVGTALRSVAEPGGELSGRAFHLAHPQPTNLVEVCERLAGIDVPRISSEAFSRGIEQLGLSVHQVALLAEDHWYDSSAVWAATGEDPGPVIDASPDALAWYRERLAAG